MSAILIRLANSAGDRWAAWMVAGLVDAAWLFGLVGLLWLALRRRVAPQVGSALFLLVALKLLVPVVVTVPAALTRCTPTGIMTAWMASPPRLDRPAVAAARSEPTRGAGATVASQPTPALVAVVGSSPPPDRPIQTGNRPASISIAAPPAVQAPTPPRLSLAAMALIGWIAGVGWLMARLVGGQLRFRSRLARMTPLDERRLPVDLEELRRLVGVGRAVRLVEDDAVAAPAVWGIWRPTIILPRGIATSLSARQLRWVLLHELAHVRRLDLVVVAVQRCAAILHFFNPVVWVANRISHQLREFACDDMAVALGRSSPVEAGEAFVGVMRYASQRSGGLDGALGILGFDSRAACLLRVHRLLDTDRPIRVALGVPSRLALLVLAAGALPSVRAAVEPPPPAPQAPTATTASSTRRPPPPPIADAPPLQDGQDFELTVVGPDGKPVADAVVDFRGPMPPADQVRRGKRLSQTNYGVNLQTDSEGKIVVGFPKVPPQLMLDLTIPGYGPYWASWAASPHKDVIPARFTAELEAGWSVGGLIVDPAGKPVAGVTVQPSIEFKKRPGDFQQLGSGHQVKTDAAGRWHYDSIPVSMSEVYVGLTHPNFRPEQRPLPRAKFGIERGAAPTARISLDRGLTVVGKVTDETGKPIVGASVRAKFQNDVRAAKTWSDGSYKLAGCQPGTGRVVVSSAGRAIDMQEVQVDAEMEPVNFAMRPGRTIRVRVLDNQGKVIPRARIFFQAWRGQYQYFEFADVSQFADEFGVWVWNEAPVDAFRADICPRNDQGMQLPNQVLIAREEEYIFRLPPALVITGKVVDAATKAPIPRFRVVPGQRSATNQMYWDQRGSFQGVDGRYQIRLDRPSPAYFVRIEAEGYRTALSRAILSNEGTVPIDFELTKGHDVVAKVVTPGLVPAAGARVALGIAGSQINLVDGVIAGHMTFAAQTGSDEGGRFRFPAQDQDFQLIITHPTGFAQLSGTPDWDTMKLIHLEPWSRVEGTFRIGSKAVGGVPIRLEVNRFSGGADEPRVSTLYEATTDPDGHYRFERVTPGKGWVGRRIFLTVEDGSQEKTSSRMVATDFPPGKTIKLDLGGTGRSVVGKFQPRAGFAGKVPWNFGLVTVMLAGPDADGTGLVEATIDRDGTFRLDDIPAGPYLMNARFQRGGVGQLVGHPFTVPAGDDGPADPPVDLGLISLDNN